MQYEDRYLSYMSERYQQELQLPMYQMYLPGGNYEIEESYERDFRKLQELFPREAKLVQVQVREQCDQLEYMGSSMFDEYPDRCTIEALCRRIYRNLNPQEELTGVQCENPSLLQLIQVMLLSEMHFRRCRQHRLGRRYW